MKICTIDGCNEKHKCLGYCRKHYMKHYRYGDPLHEVDWFHGMQGTPEYTTWRSMINRCTYEKHENYKYYGAKGVMVCDEWRHSFNAFFSDMGLKPFPRASIDRIDSSIGYEKNNCRWISIGENMRRRKDLEPFSKLAKILREEYPTWKGSQKALGVKYGVDQSTVSRVVRGLSWSEQEAL